MKMWFIGKNKKLIRAGNGVLIDPHCRRNTDRVRRTVEEFYKKYPFPEYDHDETIGTLIDKSRKRVFPELLNRALGFQDKVLEVGCGTGQLGNFLAISGRKVLSTDMCLASLAAGQKFKRDHLLESITFLQGDLFNLPLKTNFFDAVICTGVLHHTDSAQKGYLSILRHLKKGGIIIVGLYNKYMRLPTMIRKPFFKAWGEKAAGLDPYLRVHDIRGKKKTAWIQDQYFHPHESTHSIDEVLRWFKETNVSFIRSIPSTIYGKELSLTQRESLFDPVDPMTHAERLLVQIGNTFGNQEGGLFMVIGRK